MDSATLLLFLVGIVLLIAGAKALVCGAARLAAVIGNSPLVIGLTIVAFGTGSPERAVNLRASVAGEPAIGLGNVIWNTRTPEGAALSDQFSSSPMT